LINPRRKQLKLKSKLRSKPKYLQSQSIPRRANSQKEKLLRKLYEKVKKKIEASWQTLLQGEDQCLSNKRN
jgi:hypothetical protein